MKSTECRTPMHIACMLGNITTMKILVDGNVQLNSVDGKMKVPLYYLKKTKKRLEEDEKNEAKVKKLEIVMEILQEKGAKFTWKRNVRKYA